MAIINYPPFSRLSKHSYRNVAKVGDRPSFRKNLRTAIKRLVLKTSFDQSSENDHVKQFASLTNERGADISNKWLILWSADNNVSSN